MSGRRRTAALGIAALLVLSVLSTTGHSRKSVAPAASTPTPRAYVVAQDGRVRVLDTRDGSVVASARTGALTTDAVVTPDGGTLYVVHGWNGVVTALDPRTGVIKGRLDTGAQLAEAVLRPDGKRLYVTGGDTVGVVDPETFRLVAAIRSGGRPQGIVVTDDGALLYVANTQDGTVGVIDTETATTIATIHVGGLPQHVALTPDAVYVSSLHLGANALGTVTMIDRRTRDVRWSAPVGRGAGHIAVTPDGAHVYVALTKEVAVLDLATRAVERLPFEVTSLAIAPGDRRVFLATGDTTTVLDSADNSVLATFPLSEGFAATAIVFERAGPAA